MIAESLFIAQEEQIQSKRRRKQLRSSVVRARIPVGIYDDILIFAFILQNIHVKGRILMRFADLVGNRVPVPGCDRI